MAERAEQSRGEVGGGGEERGDKKVGGEVAAKPNFRCGRKSRVRGREATVGLIRQQQDNKGGSRFTAGTCWLRRLHRGKKESNRGGWSLFLFGLGWDKDGIPYDGVEVE